MNVPGDLTSLPSADASLLHSVNDVVRRIRKQGGSPDTFADIVSELGPRLMANRCYISQLRPRNHEESVICIHAEWNGNGVAANPPQETAVPVSAAELGSSYAWDRLANGVSTDELAGLPASFRDCLIPGDARTLVCVPINVHRELWGWIGVEDIDSGEMRLDSVPAAVQLVADSIGTILEQHQTELERARLNAMFEHSEDAIISKTLDGTIVNWNNAAERIYGYSADEMIGNSITRLIPGSYLDEFHEIMGRLRSGQRIEHHQTRRVRKSGDHLDISLSISPIFDREGRIAGALSIARDISELNQSQLELRTSEQRLKLALEAGNIGAWDWDVQTNEVVWSSNMELLHGLQPGTFEGTFDGFRASIHPDDYEQVIERIKRAIDGEETYALEYRSLREDGSYQWLSTKGSVLRAADGSPLRMTGVCYDVTGRKRAEAAQLELLAQVQRARSEADEENVRLRDMFQHAPAMMALLEGPEHVFVLANEHYLRSVGLRDVLGKPIIEALPEVADQGIVDLLDQVYRSGETITRSELPVLIDQTGDGLLEELYFSFAYQPFRGSDGNVTGVLVHAVNLTEHVRSRKRVEQLASVVASERDRLQQVIDVMPEGVSITDERGAFVLVNSAGLKIWGQPAPSGDYHHYSTFECYFPDGTRYATEELPLSRSILAGEEILAEQLTIRNVERGDLVSVLVNSVPLRNSDGVINGAVAVFQDISGLKEFERQKDEFLQSVTHDLRNPLTTILGNVQLLRRASSPDSERIEMLLTNTESASNRAIALIDEILDLTRLQMGRSLEMSNSTVDLVDLVRSLAEQHQAMTSEHKIVVQLEVAELTGECDELRLERVIANLISNAIIYSPDGGTVTVRIGLEATDDGPRATISIEDEGLGIPEHEIPLLFQRFWRGSNVRDAVRGTGLGLAGAKAIAEAHGGSITVESVEGEGSTFTLSFPLEASSALQES